jgi:hypothetical protein
MFRQGSLLLPPWRATPVPVGDFSSNTGESAVWSKNAPVVLAAAPRCP